MLVWTYCEQNKVKALLTHLFAYWNIGLIILVRLLWDFADQLLFLFVNFHSKADEADEDDYYYDVWDEDDYSDSYDEQNKRPVTRIDYKK